jgi:transposase InsO family protein
VRRGRNYQVGSNLIAYLNVVDIKSQKAWSEKLTSKGAVDVTGAMKKILKDIQRDGKVVKNLITDSGKEFFNKHFANLLETLFDEPIEHHTSSPKDFAKNGIVERFNRTMRRRVEGFMKK